MSNRIRCSCRRCTIRGLMAPAIIIAVGILFLLHETGGGRLSLDNTYPVILIVIGAISLAAAASSTEGHILDQLPPQPPGTVPAAPQNPAPGQRQGL